MLTARLWHRAAVAVRGGWRWQVVDAAHMSPALFADWVQLAERCDLPLVAGPHWMQCFQRAFVPPGRGVVHALYCDDRLVCVVPVVRSGRLSRVLLSMANEHSPIWSFAIDTSVPSAADRVLDRLLAEADWLLFGRLRPSDPAFQLLASTAAARGLATCVVEYSGDVRVELGRSFEDLTARWSPGMAKEARRRLRRCARTSDLAVERADDPELVPAILDECFALEARTWKGRCGTAMQSEARVRSFYEELARTMSDRGELALYVLRCSGRIVAFDFGVRGARRLDSLKVAFDPDHARLAPGNLLTFHLLVRETQEGQVSSVHLGRPAESKRRFTTSIEPLVSLRIFGSGARSRAAYLVGPALRGRLKKVPWVVALYRRTESVVPAAERVWRRIRGLVGGGSAGNGA